MYRSHKDGPWWSLIQVKVAPEPRALDFVFMSVHLQNLEKKIRCILLVTKLKVEISNNGLCSTTQFQMKD